MRFSIFRVTRRKIWTALTAPKSVDRKKNIIANLKLCEKLLNRLYLAYGTQFKGSVESL